MSKMTEKKKDYSRSAPARKKVQPANNLPFDAAAGALFIASKDKVMGRLIRKIGPCTLSLMEMHSCFESLLESIVYQQLTGKAAATIMTRVKSLYGDSFPSPQELLKTKDEDLRAAGLSRAKTLAVKDLAEKTKARLLPDLPELEKMDDQSIIESLSSVRGIGEWTVQMLLIFKLGRPDIMPGNDYGVRKAYAQVYKMEDLPTAKQLLQATEHWSPYRTLGAWYLWRALD